MVVRLRECEDAREGGADAEPDRRTQQRVPDDPAGAEVELGKGDRSAGRRDGDQGCAGASSLRQRPRVRRQGSAEMARRYRSEDGLYRAGKSVGERLLRELQLEAAGRVPERRDLLLDERDRGAGGAVASPLQHRPAALFAGLPATGPRGMGGKELGVWRSGKRYALPTSPHPRR